MTHPIAPMILRGEVITDNLVEVGGRGGDLTFLTPDAHRYADRLPLGNPSRLADLYRLTFDEILDFAADLGKRLDLGGRSETRNTGDENEESTDATALLHDSLLEAFHSAGTAPARPWPAGRRSGWPARRSGSCP